MWQRFKTLIDRYCCCFSKQKSTFIGDDQIPPEGIRLTELAAFLEEQTDQDHSHVSLPLIGGNCCSCWPHSYFFKSD